MLSAHRATPCVRRSQRQVEERLTLAASGSARTLQDAELRELRRELERLRSENDRLARIVGLVGPRPLPDEAPRSPLFGGFPGAVDHASSPADKVMFFRHLFAGREDVHALRWENDRTGRAGWMPAVEGGFRRGRTNRTYMPLTDEAITAHLAGSIHAGLYPLMDGDTCLLLAWTSTDHWRSSMPSHTPRPHAPLTSRRRSKSHDVVVARHAGLTRPPEGVPCTPEWRRSWTRSRRARGSASVGA